MREARRRWATRQGGARWALWPACSEKQSGSHAQTATTRVLMNTPLALPNSHPLSDALFAFFRRPVRRRLPPGPSLPLNRRKPCRPVPPAHSRKPLIVVHPHAILRLSGSRTRRRLSPVHRQSSEVTHCSSAQLETCRSRTGRRARRRWTTCGRQSRRLRWSSPPAKPSRTDRLGRPGHERRRH